MFLILLVNAAKANRPVETKNDSTNQILIHSSIINSKDEKVYLDFELKSEATKPSIWTSGINAQLRNYMTQSALEETFLGIGNNLTFNTNAELIRGPICTEAIVGISSTLNLLTKSITDNLSLNCSFQYCMNGVEYVSELSTEKFNSNRSTATMSRFGVVALGLETDNFFIQLFKENALTEMTSFSDNWCELEMGINF